MTLSNISAYTLLHIYVNKYVWKKEVSFFPHTFAISYLEAKVKKVWPHCVAFKCTGTLQKDEYNSKVQNHILPTEHLTKPTIYISLLTIVERAAS